MNNSIVSCLKMQKNILNLKLQKAIMSLSVSCDKEEAKRKNRERKSTSFFRNIK